MFTGLIETVGKIESVAPFGQGVRLAVDVSGLKTNPSTGASVAVDGVCLTVTERRGKIALFDAVAETVHRSALAAKGAGAGVNLESALTLQSPLDGHLVLGHVDAVGVLLEITRLPESAVLRFSLPEEIAHLVAEKGSVAISGVSLTVVDAGADSFTVSAIPETLKRTTLGAMSPGAKVNLEADVLARYVARLAACGGFGKKGLSLDKLRENGFA